MREWILKHFHDDKFVDLFELYQGYFHTLNSFLLKKKKVDENQNGIFDCCFLICEDVILIPLQANR